jgi:hypothetical protein
MAATSQHAYFDGSSILVLYADPDYGAITPSQPVPPFCRFFASECNLSRCWTTTIVSIILP